MILSHPNPFYLQFMESKSPLQNRLACGLVGEDQCGCRHLQLLEHGAELARGGAPKLQTCFKWL